MNEPCDSIVNCPNPATYPLTGYNSQTPDVVGFLANAYGPLTPPPLNWSFQDVTGYGHATSPVSLAAAQAQAAVVAAQSVYNGWNDGTVQVPSGEPEFYGNAEIFDNDFFGLSSPALT